MTKKIEYRELVIGNTIPISQCNQNEIGPFKWLSDSIIEGKAPLKINSVDFIIIKILNRNKQVYKFNRKFEFDVYVIGSFRKLFNPTFMVAQSFADFYLEMGILPNVISVPKHIFLKNTKEYSNKIRNGILIYERR